MNSLIGTSEFSKQFSLFHILLLLPSFFFLFIYLLIYFSHFPVNLLVSGNRVMFFLPYV